MIYLIYQSPWPVGGSTSYTVHLAKVLGDACRVVRIGKRTERNKRKLSDFGVEYQIMSINDVCELDGPVLLTASSPKQDENDWIALGKRTNVWSAFYDPNEFWLYPHWKHFNKRRVICIRRTGLKHIPSAVLIPLPYVRAPHEESRTRLAISIARTSGVKNTHWIMEANRQLGARKKVELHGEWNRMWYAHFVAKRYPEYAPTAGYPREWGAGVRLCAQAQFMVDLTIFKKDGGGAQYTLLEAMDAGAVPIMSSDWVSYPGPARTFGPAVGSAAELVGVLNRVHKLPVEAQRKQNHAYLERVHGVSKIKSKYLYTLT